MEDELRTENTVVAIRVRPILSKESELASEISWDFPSYKGLRDLKSEKTYTYDRVFPPSTMTSEVYSELAAQIVENSMEGYNGCLFCYGQTGSGKTFTMHGIRSACPGLVNMAIGSIFDHIEETPSREYMLRCSYLEIYNECVNDLLNSNNLNLHLQEDKKTGIRVLNLTEEVCSSFNQVNALLYVGENNKHLASTNFNQRSSRSHCIFRIIIESKAKGGQSVNFAVLNMIDLAGSESAAAHNEGTTKNRAREMKYINRSLLTLGTVIMRLSDRNNNAPIPYRDSKLTRLLKHSLNGKSKIMIVCNIAPLSQMYEESLSTLKFAQRAKKIRNTVKKNEVIDSALLLKKYEAEIQRLQTQIREMESLLDQRGPGDINSLEEKILNMEDERGRREHELESILKEKLGFEEELRKLKSFIISSESVRKKFDYFSQEQRRPQRSRFNPVTRTVTEGLIIQESDSDDEMNDKRRESMLIDKVESITQLLALENPLEDIHCPTIEIVEEVEPEYPLSREELINIIKKQQEHIQKLESKLREKDLEVPVINDELKMHRSKLNY